MFLPDELSYQDYKYEGMLVHSFDSFYVVTKFILPSFKDLKFSKLNYGSTSAYMQEKYGYTLEVKGHI